MLKTAVAVGNPILQFGTSRFLQAHVDLFVSEALARGEAVGAIAVVQTTDSADSAERIAALSGGTGYPVRIRGRQNSAVVDEMLTGHAIRQAVQARTDWARVREAVCGPVQIIVSAPNETSCYHRSVRPRIGAGSRRMASTSLSFPSGARGFFPASIS